MLRLKKKRRFGTAYSAQPWIVVVQSSDSYDEEAHQFRTEEEADAFIAKTTFTPSSPPEPVCTCDATGKCDWHDSQEGEDDENE